jgi:6-phosphogluconolactonase/glucosamine-6-phosphate isomerase/deaminase
MHLVTTDTPAKLAGEHISDFIQQHEGDIVCLLSGGSALDIVEYIKAPDQMKVGRGKSWPSGPERPESHSFGQELNSVVEKSECRTIFMMGDERGSRDAEINNSLQLLERYPNHYVTENLILTVPEASENLENFTSRISETFSTEILKLKNPKILQVLGVGSDGHTAGIFPLPKETFTATYDRPDVSIVTVHLEGLTIDSRASVTPNWILTRPDELIVYIVGAGKNRILESLIHETKEIYERPAELIKHHTGTTVYTDQPTEVT